MRNAKHTRHRWSEVLYAVAGGIAGSIVGGWLARYWPPLGHNYLVLGSQSNGPWVINLRVVGIQAGFWLQLNLGGILGILLALVVWRRRV